MSRLRNWLVRQEGVKLTPYRDSLGFLSIGIGRNLDSTGITLTEAYSLLDNDIARATTSCEKNFLWFKSLSPARADAMVAMVFQLGISRTLEFHRFLAAIAAGDYAEAANQLDASLWSKQTPRRAKEVSFLIRSGVYGPEAKA